MTHASTPPPPTPARPRFEMSFELTRWVQRRPTARTVARVTRKEKE